MAKKKKNEEAAWDEYLASIQEKPAAEEKKGRSFGERLRGFFSRLGFKKKAREEKALEKQVEISAKEGKKIAMEGQVKKEVADESQEKFHLAIEDYLARIEEQRKLEERKAAEETEFKAGKGAEEAEKPAAAGEEAAAGGAEKEIAVPAVSKRILFLPKARAKKAAVEKEKPEAKKGKAGAVPKAAAAPKPAVIEPPMIPVKSGMLEKFLVERPSMAKKSVREIKALSPEEIRQAVKLERIARKTAGWYGDMLRHKKAALSGWRIRKKVRLHQLKKKEKGGRLSKRDAVQKRALVSDDVDLREKINQLDSQIRGLRRVAGQQKRDSAILEKKVKSVGVEIPKADLRAAEKGMAGLKENGVVIDVVEAIKSVADQLAAGAARQSMAGVSLADALTIDEQIQTQQRMIHNLEIAFYKRKVDFEQFREKMFDYQSKLSEMRIKKRISDDRLADMTPEMREMLREKARDNLGYGAGTGREGISPRVASALEKIAEAPKPAIDEKFSEAMRKIAEQEAQRATERTEDKRFAERTADALQKIAEKLSTVQKTERVEERPAPRKEEAVPKREGAEEEYTPMKRPGITREGGEKYEKIRREIERAEAQEEKSRQRVVERVVERQVERAPERQFEPKPGISPVVGTAIREKAAESSISKSQVDRIEQRLGELLEKYHIPDRAVAAQISSLDSDRLVQDFQKLIGLIESKKEAAAAEFIKPAPGFDISTGIISKKREKITGQEKDIKRARIETSFDLLLNLVQLKGIVTLDDAAKELGINKKQAQDCAEILESNKLIEMIYPPIGSVKLIYPRYLKWKEEEKEKAAALKKEVKKKK